MTDKIHLLIAGLILSTFLILSGCSNTYHDEIDRGAGYDFRPGYPELRLAATGFVDEFDDSYIVVSGDIVYGSLVYSGKDGIYKADLNIEIQILETENNNVVIRENYSETISDENRNIVNSQDVERFEYQYEVSPGEYTVQVIVIDETSGRQTSRSTKTSIPNPQDSNSHITEIRLLGKDASGKNSEFNQATTYDIPSRLDSLKFIFQVTNNNPEEPIEIETRLLKFKADTSVARPMNFVNYSPSTLPYVGIDYDEFDIIQSSSRRLNQPGSVIIELAFENLARGNYRLEVTSNEGEDNELYKGRAFGIKSPNYPSLKTAEELARPLAYLMSDKEYDQIIAIKDPDSLKTAVDRFWLSNIKNSTIARNVISMYYQRVEEANKQFSNFKEGWKTDPGMIYILFGPPWYNQMFGDKMYWSYSYNRNDPEKNFVFTRTKLNTKYYPFNNYLLERANYYYSIQYSQIERWLSGSILNTNL
ncbi:MAG: GWxTD domain-containing protein [Gracilimonas sp.]|uniref:GWxTD domain-containing protein n=1 Tax=Gracilimonas sp. TaxID=1974203 RepID=UPI00198349D9|nr:GWxTD domain-containing protein [Gracilimonas sp.]MBD3616382.1 GWxTD domain-containing protein [Gracilimonas sp.]